MQTRSQKYALQIFRQIENLLQSGERKIAETLTQEGGETRKVVEVRKQVENGRKQYGSMAHKLPVLIRTAGLVQALGFVDAKAQKNEMHRRLLNDLATTLDKPTTLVSESRTAQLGEYMRLTQQVLDALLWYKRFAQSVLNVEGGDEAGDEP